MVPPTLNNRNCGFDNASNMLADSKTYENDFLGEETSILHRKGLALSIGSLFCNNDVAPIMPTTHNMRITGDADEHMSPLMEGGDDDNNWYCPHCGDGPYDKWQRSCHNCHTNN